MEIEFQDTNLKRLALDAGYTKKPPALVKGYRKRINQIQQAPSRQVLYAFRSLRLEALKGKRQGQHSMRINDQYRLIVVFKPINKHEKVVILAIEDYH